MPENLPIAEYGVAIASMLVLGFVVRLFVSHVDKKDEKFTNVISNHLQHSTESQQKLSSAIDQNTQATVRLSDKIDKKP